MFDAPSSVTGDCAGFSSCFGAETPVANFLIVEDDPVVPAVRASGPPGVIVGAVFPPPA